ncbi:MAG: DNA primase [Candidatus Rokubacteria bacterium]|nr:DNA primase [Candidatus Rokubacteria bacterium]
MAGYSPALLDEIRTGVDIVELVGRFVNLKKAGQNWKGLCPFHGEKTPSFMVNPAKGIFHCFGCGVGGDAFGFLMRQDKLTFPEAVRALAKTAGVTLPEEREARPGESGREELLRVMELAARFYEETLWKPAGERARAYLDKRGIDAEVAKRFRLGYAPDAWDTLVSFMKSERVPEETLLTVGLVKAREQRGGVYDAFRGRLLFAIRDLQGRVVAFGGRAFGDEPPKYLNSPETPLYSKGHLMYAADLAREAMRDKGRALVVEGYVDCLMAHQYGFTETVAALGTSFTAAQLQLLRRYTNEAVLFFDADQAGQKAAERAEALLETTAAGRTWAINRAGGFEDSANLRVRVATLPAGHDPDTFLRADGAPAFEARIAGARSLLSYALDRAVADPEGRTGARARSDAFKRAALLLAKVSDAEEATALSREAAVKLGVDATQLWIESQKLQAALGRPARPAAERAAASMSTEDRILVRLLLEHLEARVALLPLLDDEQLSHATLRAIVAALRRRPDAGAESLLSDLDDDGARSFLTALLCDEQRHEQHDPDASIRDFRTRLELGRKLRAIRETARTLAAAQAAGEGDATRLEQMKFLDREGRAVHAQALGAASPHHHGPAGPEGVHTDDD